MTVLVQVPNRGGTLPDSLWGKAKATVSQQWNVGKKIFVDNYTKAE